MYPSQSEYRKSTMFAKRLATFGERERERDKRQEALFLQML